MREGPSSAQLARAVSWRPVVSSWLGGELLASEVPVISGRLTATVSQQVPERLTLRVPEWADDRSWVPGIDVRHPLARFGQVLDVTILTGDGLLSYETRMGRLRVQSWRHDDVSGTVEVEAVGILQVVADDRLPRPEAPRPDGTLSSEFRRLMPAGIGVQVDDGLADRACPRSMQWAEDRLGALYEIADAWPARLRTDEWGQVRLLPPLGGVPEPVLSLTDGEGGTVVSASRADTRDQAYNRVVVRSSVTDDPAKPPIQAIVDQVEGPFGVYGPYGVVPRFFSSPLITSVLEAEASGRTMLANSLRPSRTLPVTLAPDPRIDLDDPVEVVRDGVRHWGWVVAYDIPLTVADGAMRVDVAVTA